MAAPGQHDGRWHRQRHLRRPSTTPARRGREILNEGTNFVSSSVTYTIGADDTLFVDNLRDNVDTGSANINGTGNGLATVITGNSGDNTLDGGAGADTIAGGDQGNDIYVVDNAGDVVTEALNQGTDSVQCRSATR